MDQRKLTSVNLLQHQQVRGAEAKQGHLLRVYICNGGARLSRPLRR